MNWRWLASVGVMACANQPSPGSCNGNEACSATNSGTGGSGGVQGSTTIGGANAIATGGSTTTATGGALTTATGGSQTTAAGGADATATGGSTTTAAGGALTTTTGGADATATGGSTTTAAGGALATATGGSPTTVTGGTSSTGGVRNSGGASSTGGARNSGGTSSTGGTGNSGGTKAIGGASSQKTLASTSLAVRFANAVLSRWPDPGTLAATTAVWDYNHGIVLRGIEQVYRYTSDSRYLAYIQKYADEFVSSSGAITIPAAHSFDNIEPSVLLPFLFQQTGLARYHTAADTIRARYDSIPRNVDNGFWHKQADPNQMWLDSIYMGEPFLARYGAVFGTCGTFCASTVVEQTTLVAQHVQDTATGLLYHAWDDSAAGSKAAWADPTTGRSPVIWGRAMGWFAMSLVDTLDDLPTNQSGRSTMLNLVTSVATAIKNTQDSKTGLWFQVVDQGSRSDDWLESSGSGMFVYFLKVAVNRGYIDSGYLTVANAGWQGLQTQVTTDSVGPIINSAVQGMSVQTNYAGYINQTKLSNSSHGLCAILLAASEMEAQ